VVVYGDVGAATMGPDLSRLRWIGAGRAAPAPFAAGSWLAVASLHGRVAGYARAERTPDPFPADHPRSAAARELGVDRRDEWLAGGLELVELVVDPAARRKGVGRALQSAAASPAVGRRAWTALASASPAATPFSVACGWARVTGPDRPCGGAAVLLAPDHPLVRSGRLPRFLGPVECLPGLPRWIPQR
jgi:GNAT superfamily N-acetyltransferase